MDLRLTPEQTQFRDAARAFLDAEVVPHRKEWDRAERIDSALIPKLGELGFFAVAFPEEYGGLGTDLLTYAIAMEELGRADSSVRGIVSVSAGLFGKTVLAHGTQEQKQRWLPGIAGGELIGCFGLTEPGHGSDAAHLTTRARRDGDDWVLDGSKIFITNAPIADVAVVFARTDPEQSGARGVSAFIVPTSTPGLTVSTIDGKLGLRGQATGELAMDGVRLPADALLGEEGRGFSYAMGTLDKGRIGIAASCVGIIRACVEESVKYATQREQFGAPIATRQLVQEMIADMSVDLDAAQLLTWRAADLADRGEPFGVAASKAKLFASEAAVRSSNLAVQVFGGYGFVDDYPVQKFLRDARVTTLYEGTSQVQKLLIGRAETNISAF